LNRQSGKIFIWVLLGLLVAGGLAAFWHFNPAQQPDWVASRLPTAPDVEVTTYRWQDANGEWNFSSERPPEGVEFEVVRYRHDTNVMPAVEREDED
jgi:hypothetical protein